MTSFSCLELYNLNPNLSILNDLSFNLNCTIEFINK